MLPHHCKRTLTAILIALASLTFGETCLAQNVAISGGVGHYVTSNSGANPFVGINVNTFLGANTFYNAGYTGTTVRVANIEGGHVWNGHETLSHVTTFINGPTNVGALQGNTAATDRHATWVGHTIAGRVTAGGGEYQRGIAYGATLWSGSLATSFGSTAGSYNGSFNFTNADFFQPYVTATKTGVSGNTADVVNSSWGFQGDSAGRSFYSQTMDALARDTGKVFVFSAGNSGPTTNTVGGPATSYNVISVAALGSDLDAQPFNTVSSFSSRGRQNVFIPTVSATSTTGTTIVGGRIRIDIAAPGQNLTLAYYGGATGGNTGNTADGASDFYSTNVAGTSFSAPTVAGGASLMVDVARQLSLANGTDGRVVKAVLMNSADKTSGWTNNQTLSSGVIRTTQAVDQNVGTGRMNLAAAYQYYGNATSTRGNTTVSPTNAVTVMNRGYDLATAIQGASLPTSTNDYTLTSIASGIGSSLTVTLTWLADRGVNSFANPTVVSDNKLANLDLEIWSLVNGVFTTKVAESTSLYNNSEHLHLNNLSNGQFGLRVVYVGDVWDFTNSSTELYALAWNYTPVPEPGSILAIGATVLLIVRRVRRKTSA